MPGVEFEAHINALRERIRRGGMVDHRSIDKLSRRAAPVGCAIVSVSAVIGIILFVRFLVLL